MPGSDANKIFLSQTKDNLKGYDLLPCQTLTTFISSLEIFFSYFVKDYINPFSEMAFEIAFSSYKFSHYLMS